MDWRSSEGKMVLRAAYPYGYLQARGVKTLGGWTALENAWLRPNLTVAAAPYTGDDSIHHAALVGDLLPDPTDATTWTLMVQDLAEAASPATGPWDNLIWQRQGQGEYHQWCLREEPMCLMFGRRGGDLVSPWALTTDHPIEALVRARALVRT